MGRFFSDGGRASPGEEPEFIRSMVPGIRLNHFQADLLPSIWILHLAVDY